MPNLSKKERDVLLSFSTRVDRNDSGALNNLGVLYFRKGMYEEAIAQFKEALKIDSRFDLARENIRYLFNETNLEDPDVSRWREEVEKDPDNTEALLRLGVSYQNMGRYDRAAEVLGSIVEQNPGHIMARIHLGSVLKAQGLYQQALDHYLCIKGDVKNSVVFHTDLGEIYYNLGRTEETVSELRTAIKLDADYWRSHFLLSFAYGDDGNLQDALEESRIASRLNPSFQNTEANLALADYRKGGDMGGDGAKGIPSLESTSFTLGIAYRERGYFKEALNEFSKALQEMPDKDRVYAETGKVHLAGENYDKAMLTFLKALEANPENAEVYRFLGSIHHLAEKYNLAAASYLQAFRLNSIDADTMNNLGVLLYQVGLLEEAERMFKQGLNLKLYHAELNYNFLTCNILKEEFQMSENLIQRLEAFMGKSAVIYERRALLNYRLDRLTLALFDVESALSLDRNHSDALYLRGLIFLRQQDFQGAIDSILEAAKVRPKYTGFCLSLALDEKQELNKAMVDSTLSFDPDGGLIELLQAGIKRRFDKIQDTLLSVASSSKAELNRLRGAESPGNGGASGDAVEKPAGSGEVSGDSVEKSAGIGEAGVGGPELLLEALEEISNETAGSGSARGNGRQLSSAERKKHRKRMNPGKRVK